MVETLLREGGRRTSDSLVSDETVDVEPLHGDGTGLVAAIVISLPVCIAAWGVAIWAILRLLR